MYANTPEFEFQGTILKFRKRNKILPCLFTFSIKHEIRHFTSYLCKNGKEMYKKARCLCKVLFLGRFCCRRVRLNLKVPNLKKIGDYLQPKPGAIINYSAWPKQSPHHNTISRYTSRVNLILTNLRTKIHKWYSASLGEPYQCYKGYNTIL